MSVSAGVGGSCDVRPRSRQQSDFPASRPGYWRSMGRPRLWRIIHDLAAYPAASKNARAAVPKPLCEFRHHPRHQRARNHRRSLFRALWSKSQQTATRLGPNDWYAHISGVEFYTAARNFCKIWFFVQKGNPFGPIHSGRILINA